MHKPSIIERIPFTPHPFEQLTDFDQNKIGKENYENHCAWLETVTDTNFETVHYSSDGLKVVALMAQPNDTAKKYPVIIYNRGGSHNYGMVTLATLHDVIYPFVQAGYIVIAPQYRGNDGGQGKDELGGKDLADVMNLVTIAQQLPEADPKNIFMLGHSRGGLMTYQAIAHGARLNAAASWAGVADLFAFEENRPDAIPVLQEIIPFWNTNKEQEYANRSAVRWPEKITVPLLLIHGDNDEIVNVAESEHLAQLLKERNKQYSLIIYPDDNHYLSNNRAQAIKETLNWFEQFKK